MPSLLQGAHCNLLGTRKSKRGLQIVASGYNSSSRAATCGDSLQTSSNLLLFKAHNRRFKAQAAEIRHMHLQCTRRHTSTLSLCLCCAQCLRLLRITLALLMAADNALLHPCHGRQTCTLAENTKSAVPRKCCKRLQNWEFLFEWKILWRKCGNGGGTQNESRGRQGLLAKLIPLLGGGGVWAHMDVGNKSQQLFSVAHLWACRF